MLFDLDLYSTKPVVLQGGDGIVGDEDSETSNSYYYSFTNMDTQGFISFKGKWGRAGAKIYVTGKTWFDRQWGAFPATEWNWWSLRFTDGEEIMLFDLPADGYRGGTYIDKDGSATEIKDFTYTTTEYIPIPNRRKGRFGQGWSIKVPHKEQEYYIEPLYEGDIVLNPIIDYWEGLCKITNSKGEFKGWAVVEITE